MSYKVIISPTVEKQLDALSPVIAVKLLAKILSLRANPRPHGCKKLKESEGWRVRVGDYRAIYEIDDKASVVSIRRVGHKGEMYR